MRPASILVRACVLLFVLIGLSRPGGAQTRIGGGYQFLHETKNDERDTSNYPAGWAVDVEQHIFRTLSVVGNIDRSSQTTRRNLGFGNRDAIDTFVRTAFAAGLRWSPQPSSSSALTGYLHVLGGVSQFDTLVDIVPAGESGGDPSELDSFSKPMIQVGGGLRQRLGSRLNLLGQADFRRLTERYKILNVVDRQYTVHVLRLFVGAQVTVRQ